MNILKTQIFKMAQDVGKLLGKECKVKCEEGKKAGRISVKNYVATDTSSLGWYTGRKHFGKKTKKTKTKLHFHSFKHLIYYREVFNFAKLSHSADSNVLEYIQRGLKLQNRGNQLSSLKCCSIKWCVHKYYKYSSFILALNANLIM